MSTLIKVYGFHLDIFEHVNNARYLEFLEQARWDWIEQHLDFSWFKRNGVALVVANININYRTPANLGDELIVDCNVAEIGVKSGVLSQKIVRKKDGVLISDALVTFVLIDINTKKALMLTDQLREKLEYVRQSSE
ncbi:MAG TPA: acyl-CoA thioesterase [Proteus sp.]|uniref:4-hydroxybenzoyl-CoA thioesterase family protein n=1 Tax=Proteus hauseri ATCC 700826 TaxID=1354271 RepID=A0AAJ3HUV4_PROHU|nr:thioesterase family protein [Proteus hauseri]OAT48582.1 4-hydroxybenzoyl-CoA thioesterase family protein [Proteus hauseri ATCC 700826]HCH50118.1 acyl-CoA thioesterase [Proteus sp. (in: enterobacteria)]